jgi:hypothetical protein
VTVGEDHGGMSDSASLRHKKAAISDYPHGARTRGASAKRGFVVVSRRRDVVLQGDRSQSPVRFPRAIFTVCSGAFVQTRSRNRVTRAMSDRWFVSPGNEHRG